MSIESLSCIVSSCVVEESKADPSRAAKRRRNASWLVLWMLAILAFATYALALLLPSLDIRLLGLRDDLGILGTPLGYFSDDTQKWGVFMRTGVVLGVLLATQLAFLLPMRRRAGDVSGASGKSLKIASASAAFAAMLFSAGLIATLLEIPDWWTKVFSMGGDPADGHSPLFVIGISTVLVSMLLIWCAWAFIFYKYWKQGDTLTRAGRILQAILAGSCLELLVTIPVHAWTYRVRTDQCYCVRGSYTGLVFGFGALVWVFGPGVAFLFLREKRRREKVLRRLCPQCGALLPPCEDSKGCPVCAQKSNIQS